MNFEHLNEQNVDPWNLRKYRLSDLPTDLTTPTEHEISLMTKYLHTVFQGRIYIPFIERMALIWKNLDKTIN